MLEHEELSEMAIRIDGIKERFEDSRLLAFIVRVLHDIAKRHNPDNYEDENGD